MRPKDRRRGTFWSCLAYPKCKGLFPSDGSTGDAYDNAAMETFWATLKGELAWIRGSLFFATREGLKSVLLEYIEVFYNRERAQAGLGHKSPVAYEAAVTAA